MRSLKIALLGLLTVPLDASAAEVTIKRSYSRYQDKLSVVMKCTLNQMQRHRPCVALSVGVDGASVTPRNSPRQVYSLEIEWLMNPVPFDMNTCNNFELRHDRGVLKPKHHHSTTLLAINSTDSGRMTYCSSDLMSKKVSCPAEVPVGLDQKAPRHLHGETHVKVEFLGLTWCEISPLRSTKKLVISACGEDYEVKAGYVSAVRQFATLFPQPLGYECNGDRIIRKCTFAECKTPESRLQLARAAVQVMKNMFTVMAGGNCGEVAGQLARLLTDGRSTMAKFKVIRDHLTEAQQEQLRSEYKSLEAMTARKLPCEKDPAVERALQQFGKDFFK